MGDDKQRTRVVKCIRRRLDEVLSFHDLHGRWPDRHTANEVERKLAHQRYYLTRKDSLERHPWLSALLEEKNAKGIKHDYASFGDLVLRVISGQIGGETVTFHLRAVQRGVRPELAGRGHVASEAMLWEEFDHDCWVFYVGKRKRTLASLLVTGDNTRVTSVRRIAFLDWGKNRKNKPVRRELGKAPPQGMIE